MPCYYLNCGMPRSGTTWVFNVIRLLLENKNIPFKSFNLIHSQEVDNILKTTKNNNLLLHFHEVTPAVLKVLNSNKIPMLYNYRDPRDIVVSQMNLLDISFKKAVLMTYNACEIFRTLLEKHNVLLIPYRAVLHFPNELIEYIAKKIYLSVENDDINMINEKTSKKAFTKTMKELVQTNKDNHLMFDSKTLITGRHIQSGKIGRWQEELSLPQQKIVNNKFHSYLDVMHENETAFLAAFHLV